MPKAVATRDYIRTLDRTQQSVSYSYPARSYEAECCKAVEKQSANFLSDYIDGKIKLDQNAGDAFDAFLVTLKSSSYEGIVSLLEEAKNKRKQQLIEANKNEVWAQDLSKNRFAILQNKKEMAKLSSAQLLLIAEKLEAERGYSTKILQDKLRNFAQNKIERTFRNEIPEDDDFVALVKRMGTIKHINRVDTWTSRYTPPVEEKPVSQMDMKKKEQKREKSKKKSKNSQKRSIWKKGKYLILATVLGVGGVFAGVLGMNKFKQSQPSDDQKGDKITVVVNTPVSEIKNNNDKQQSSDDIADFQTERQRIEQEQVAKAQAPELSKEDQELGERIKAFKFSQEKLGINLNSLDKVVDDLIKAGSIEISENMTPTRAKYVIAFYAQFPGTQEGKTCKALLNGKKVSLDKNTFKKWDQNLGKRGGKFTMTLKGKKVKLKGFSAMDYYKNNHQAQH